MEDMGAGGWVPGTWCWVRAGAGCRLVLDARAHQAPITRHEAPSTPRTKHPRPGTKHQAPLIELNGDQLRDAGLLHRHAVEPVRDLHRLPVVGNEDELRVFLHALEHLHETPDVRIVQRRVDTVEQAERARAVFEDG